MVGGYREMLKRIPLFQGVLGFFGLMIVLNLILQTFFSYQILGIFQQWFSMVVRMVWNGPIAKGGRFEDMTAIYKRLQEKMALPGEAAAFVKRLHVLMVHYYDAPRGMTDSTRTPAKMSPVTLDLKKIGDAGYLIFYDAPTLWRVRNANGKRARLGFDSEAPMDIRPNPDGVVAGLRVTPITGRFFWTLPDATRNRRVFCHRMRLWLETFGYPEGRVRLWDVQMPIAGGTLHLRRNGPTSDSGGISARSTLRLLCR